MEYPDEHQEGCQADKTIAARSYWRNFSSIVNGLSYKEQRRWRDVTIECYYNDGKLEEKRGIRRQQNSSRN